MEGSAHHVSPWPSGDSEMARRIREHDWTTTPLGPITSWPASLRAAVEICLGSQFPTALLWGPQLILLHNDAHIAVLGSRASGALGQPTPLVLADSWPVIGPLVNQVLAGHAGLAVPDLVIELDRGIVSRTAHFTVSFGLVRDDAGAPAGVLVSALETTIRVEAENRVRESEARYRALATASSDVIYRMNPDWREMRQLDGRGVLADLPEPSATWRDAYIAREDQPYVSAVIAEAVRTETPFELEHRVRLMDGSLGWTHSRAVPIWDDHGEVVEWIGAASDVTARKAAEELLRQSEARYRSLFDAIDQGFCTIEVLFDAAGQPVDYVFLDTNPVFTPITGLVDAVGRRMRDLVPDHEAYWFEIYGRIARTRVPERFEAEAAVLGYWYNVYAFPVGEPAQCQVGILFEDISGRKRAEQHQALLSDVTRELAGLKTVPEVMSHIGERIGRFFGVCHCMFTELIDEGESSHTVSGWHAVDAPSVAGVYRLRDFLADEQVARNNAGELTIVNDTQADARVSATSYGALGIRSFIVVPLVRDHQWHFQLSIIDSVPRAWREDEVALMREIAERIWLRLERARTEEALRESQARLAALLENLPDYAIFLVDPAGIVAEWTDGAAHVKGYAADEILGQHVSAFYTPEDLAADVPDRELEEAAGSGRFEGEGWRMRKSGERFWVNEIATAVRDEVGNLIGFTKISRDLTRRRQAEAALAASEERYRRIVEQATDYAIFSTDSQRRIETWPPGAQRVFGWTADEVVGQPMDITYTSADRESGVPEQELAAAQTDGFAPDARWHLHKDGRRVFIDGMTYPRQGDEGVFKVGQDVTDRVLAAESQRENEARMREELEAEVAAATLELRALSRRLLVVQEEERRRLALELHDEIGQVLTGLTFQLASATGGDGGTTLSKASATVQALTEQVRQLALDLRPQVLDRYGLLAAIEWYIARYQVTTDITVHLREQDVAQRRYAPDVEIAAFRVVQEALTNIARYAGVSEAWVTLIGNDSLLLVIHDQGRGFDLEQSGESSGLGGMRERVELLGGSFDLESVPGGGVHITAAFPLDEASPG